MSARTMMRTVAAGTAVTAAVAVLSGCSVLGSLLSGGASSGNTEAFDIEVGDCVYEPDLTDNEATDAQIASVDVVDCAEPHTYEAYVVEDIGAIDDVYPGEESVLSRAEELCYNGFADFVGRAYEKSRLDISYFYPTEDSWNTLDDREVTCFVIDPDKAETTGSFAGSGE